MIPTFIIMGGYINLVIPLIELMIDTCQSQGSGKVLEIQGIRLTMGNPRQQN